ncbi:hypothetical protein B0H14DRAFT_2906568 [Mycena olivaceomarginata]|nr:hypothetical protein B0H14DRAFT_2906568 [Mycena olivaceomarginata]
MTHYLPLDEALYKEEEVAFVKEESGIGDSDVLKTHILAVQTKAYKLAKFPCFRNFKFVKTMMSTLPAYGKVLRLGREREGALLLDLGCCCGIDIRKLAHDGFPVKNLIASDILADFWNLGHELFHSTPETFPVVFLLGDTLDERFLEPSTPMNDPSDVPDSPPSLTSLSTLTPLRGHVSVIHLSSVFHLFTEEQQLHLARALGGLLSPYPGLMILGTHLGQAAKGPGEISRADGLLMFYHSPESWRELWEGVFSEGAIKVEAELIQMISDDGKQRSWLTWCD